MHKKDGYYWVKDGNKGNIGYPTLRMLILERYTHILIPTLICTIAFLTGLVIAMATMPVTFTE